MLLVLFQHLFAYVQFLLLLYNDEILQQFFLLFSLIHFQFFVTYVPFLLFGTCHFVLIVLNLIK